MCSIDVSKAFDKISHFALFTKLIERSIHVNIINILSTWYCKSITTVSWSGIFSSMFSPEAGIRQGGILSPVLFAVYVNSLLEKLQNSGRPIQVTRTVTIVEPSFWEWKKSVTIGTRLAPA